MTTNEPVCPHSTHAGSRVVRNGVYGSLGRQRYRCHPLSDGASHTFSVPPELTSAELGDDRGQRRLRSYRHDVVEIATALVSIGRGSSYRQAAIRASAGTQINGQLVADWVRAFVPVIVGTDTARRWPAVLCAGAYTVGTTPEGGRLRLYMAVGAAGNGTAHRLWDARIASGSPYREWRTFFNGRPGKPELLICERGSEEAAVALQVWEANPPVLIEARRRLRADVEAHGKPDVSGAGPGFRIGDEDVNQHVATFTEHRATLVRRIATRYAHFRNFDQVDRLLDLMRIECNGEADVADYAKRIMAEGNPGPMPSAG